jgi:hypothetical protein
MFLLLLCLLLNLILDVVPNNRGTSGTPQSWVTGPTTEFTLSPFFFTFIEDAFNEGLDFQCGREHVLEATLQFCFVFFNFIIHMCIQGLGHFSPLPPPPTLQFWFHCLSQKLSFLNFYNKEAFRAFYKVCEVKT